MDSLYNILAKDYDKINELIDFKTWVDTIISYLHSVGCYPKSMLDIGCGTGSLLMETGKRNILSFGIDLSDEMLDIAYQKIKENHLEKYVELSCQDMTIFELNDRMDFVVCTLDGINHLSSKNKVSSCFQSVYDVLNPGGYFFFDLNTEYKFQNVYGNQIYTYDLKNKYIIWENQYHKSTKSCDFFITAFEKEKNSLYKKMNSSDKEYFYSLKSIQNMLDLSGFDCISVSSTIFGDPVTDTSEKYHIIAKKRSQHE